MHALDPRRMVRKRQATSPNPLASPAVGTPCPTRELPTVPGSATLLGLLTAFALLLVIGACAPQPESSTADEEIVLGWISPGSQSPTTSVGAVLAVEELMREGGIEVAGRRVPVRLAVAESTNSPETATSQALAMINLEGAVSLLGLASTPTALPVAKVAEAHSVPMITILSSHPEVTKNRRFSFRLTADDPTQGRALASVAREHLEAQRAGLLIDVTNPYCVSLGEAFSTAFEALGGAVHQSESYTEDQDDLDSVFDRLGSADLDLLLLPNISPRNLPALRSARERGFALPVLGGDSWAAMAPDEQGLVDDVFFLDLWAPELEPQAQRFAEQVALRQVQANGTMALGYDAVMLVAEAIRRQGSYDGEAIRGGLNRIESFLGLGGRYVFADAAGNPRRQLFLRRLDGGEARLLDRLDLAPPDAPPPEALPEP